MCSSLSLKLSFVWLHMWASSVYDLPSSYTKLLCHNNFDVIDY